MKIFHNKNVLDFIRYSLTTLLLICMATGIGWIFRLADFPETNIVVVYILSILLIARLTKGFIYGIFATIIATCCFNYFFTEPYFTLKVNNPTYFITFIIMAITAIITSTLTSKVKQSALDAKEKEAEASALYKLTNRLTSAADISDIASKATSTISNIMSCNVALLCFDEDGQPEKTFIQQYDYSTQIHRSIDDADKIKNIMQHLKSDFYIGEEFYDWPIYSRNHILGVLRVPNKMASTMTKAKIQLLKTMIENTALAMDRFRIIQENIKSKEETAQERYRGNLLRSISHDLRTPLSSIMGTSEMLMDMTEKSDERYELAEGIHKNADWLHSLVENILSLTRLQDGKLTLNKQMEAVEEVIGSAVGHIMQRTPDHEITINIPDEPLFVPMDARLIVQVLVNLLDNAVKHTPPQNKITITVSKDDKKNQSIFSISDCGSGIAPEDLPNIFQIFYTTHGKQTDSQRGVGLGLTICEAIITAHGGKIEGHNRNDGQGAEFIFSLPMEDKNGTKKK